MGKLSINLALKELNFGCNVFPCSLLGVLRFKNKKSTRSQKTAFVSYVTSSLADISRLSIRRIKIHALLLI